jgi:ABC-type nitrate/sulfonate/bicarbonate transport system substrate-binding protein
MAAVRLSTVTRTQGNNRALKDGLVTPKGYELDFIEVPVLVDAFRRMVRTLDFDVAELALSTYLCAKAYGVGCTALPVFLVRGFHHAAAVISPGGGVREPADLAGRRVGVNRGYTVTTGVWTRGVLHDEYGLDPGAVTWVPSGDEHVAAFRPPANVSPLPGADLPGLVSGGELAAAVGITATGPLVPLIPDPEAAGYAALRERGHYPINHVVVVRDDLLEAHPDLAPALFEAFTQAKDRYVARLRTTGAGGPTDERYRDVMRITGADPLPYGIEPNRAVLAELIRHLVDQRILTEPPPIDGLFAAGTRDLVG